MVKICGSLLGILLVGGFFVAVGIVLLALGGQSLDDTSYYCASVCLPECTNRDLDINDAGDIFCSKCLGSDCSASIRVTNEVYAQYSILTAFGALSLGFSVLVSIFKLLNVMKKIEIDMKTTKAKIFLAMFFSLIVIGVGFFLILFNNGSIACNRKCEPECNS